MNHVAKSVTSALVGIAIKEGYIKSVNQKVVPIFTGQEIKNLDENKQSVTIKHLLTMSSGISQQGSVFMPQEYLNSGNWNMYYLNQPMVAEPDKLYAYDNADVNLLMLILHKTSGMKNSDFAENFLFKPIGITNYYWQTDPQGDYDGGGGLAITPMEMARFGYLYLKKGNWQGKQVIPADWVEASLSDQIKPPAWLSKDKGYGYLWWELQFGGFTASGHGGQHILVMPEKDMIVVITAGLIDEYNNWRVEEYLTKECINKSIISGGSIQENPVKQEELNSSIRDLGNPPAITKVIIPETAYKISGKKYIIDQNLLKTVYSINLKSVILSFNRTGESIFESDWLDNNLNIFDSYSPNNKTSHNIKMSVGLDGKYRESGFNPHNDLHKKQFVRGKWINENTFVVEFYWPWKVESKIQFTFQYNDDKVKITTEAMSGDLLQEFIGIMEK